MPLLSFEAILSEDIFARAIRKKCEWVGEFLIGCDHIQIYICTIYNSEHILYEKFFQWYYQQSPQNVENW